MSTSATVLRAQVIAAVRGSTVSAAAVAAGATGMTALVWGSTTIPHVFDGVREGFIGGRNRGRCPFVEVQVGPQRFDSTTIDGGSLLSDVLLTAHAAERDAETLLNAILIAALAAIRSTPLYGYTAQGDDEIGVAERGPMGWKLQAKVTVMQSFDRTTYEAL